MEKIMDIIARETGGKSYNSYKYNYDSIGLPIIEYDDSNKIMKWKESAETEKITSQVDIKSLANKIRDTEPIIKYFLDGSRRIFKVDDISYNKKVYPVVAGQVGVCCCKRNNKKIYPEKFYSELVIALPKDANADGLNDKAYFASKLKKVNQCKMLKRLGLKFTNICYYPTSKANLKDKNLENTAIATIQDYMIELEKRLVSELVKKNKLGQNSYLLKDGSLEYKEMKTGREDFRTLQKIKNNYNWVIGVSKSFNPESCYDHTGKPNSDYIADLKLFNRTPVSMYKNDFLGDVSFGVWYLRIRDKNVTNTPFNGVLKIEKLLTDDELKNGGIDSEIVDLISANIINERNPTCYGEDRRWANHLYPIFLTEKYIKSKYITNQVFLNLF